MSESPDGGADIQTIMKMMEAMMESQKLMESKVAGLVEKQRYTLDESFTFDDDPQSLDQSLPHTPSQRRSTLLQKAKIKEPKQAQHLAMATPFETQALKGIIDYLALHRLRSDKRFHSNQPGNAGAIIHLWQDNYIPEATRRKIIKKWKHYFHSDAKALMDPSFTVPSEEALQVMDFKDSFALLEVAIMPEDGQDYEKAIGDIVQRLMEKNSYYSIAAQPYFLQQLTTTIEHVEMYLTIAPEAYNGKQTPYNLGTRKNHQHGTKGTVAAFMDKCMPPEMQHAIAVLMRQTATPQTLKEHFKGLKKTINDLETMLHQYNSYLKACTAAKARKPDSSAAISEIGDKTSPSSVITQPVTADLESLTADQTQHSEDQSTEHTAAMGDATQKKVDITELKETPCYAFIEGKCNSNTCLRSHDKKQILAYLEEKQKQLRGRL